MAAIANSPAFAKKVGVPQSVGQDFSAADKGRKFAKGGDTMAKKMADGGPAGMDPKMAAMLANKLKSPGVRAPGVRAPMVRPPATPAAGAMKKSGMPMEKGGMAKYATGGFVRAADGIAQKGKTKAKQIKMAGGGKC